MQGKTGLRTNKNLCTSTNKTRHTYDMHRIFSPLPAGVPRTTVYRFSPTTSRRRCSSKQNELSCICMHHRPAASSALSSAWRWCRTSTAFLIVSRGSISARYVKKKSPGKETRDCCYIFPHSFPSTHSSDRIFLVSLYRRLDLAIGLEAS